MNPFKKSIALLSVVRILLEERELLKSRTTVSYEEREKVEQHDSTLREMISFLLDRIDFDHFC